MDTDVQWMKLIDPGSEFLPTRRSLITRLKNWDDQEGWQEFFQTYWRLIYSVARKSGLDDAEAQEVVQETILSVAKKMQRFRYDPAIGSFKAWLLLNVRSRIIDHRRRAQCRIPNATKLTTEAANISEEASRGTDNDFEALWHREWQEHVVAAALQRVKSQVSAKQFQIFDLYVLKNVPLRTITSRLGVSLAQVYLAKHRVGRLVQEEARRLEAKML